MRYPVSSVREQQLFNRRRMNFYNIFFLTGLSLIIIPVLLHLLKKQVEGTKKFPAIKFLIRAKEKIKHSLFITDLLLLLLRILCIIFFTFALSMPYTGQRLLDGAEQGNVAVLLDNSMSTCYSGEYNYLERGKEVAESIMRNFSAPVLFALFNEGVESHRKILAEEFKSFKKEINCTSGSTDLYNALAGVMGLLSKGEKHIYVVTDLTRNGWDTERIRGLLENESASLTIAEIGKNAGKANFYVSDFRTAVSGDFLEVRGAVASFPPVETEIPVRLDFLDGGSAATSVRISGGTGELFFQCPLRDQSSGYVELGPDPIPQDNRRFFVSPVPGKRRLLIVDGSPDPRPFRGESYFLKKALMSHNSGDEAFHTKTVTLAGLDKTRIETFDGYMLLNTEEISLISREKILAEVKKGKGLFISAGKQFENGWLLRLISEEIGVETKQIQKGNFTINQIPQKGFMEYLRESEKKSISAVDFTGRILFFPGSKAPSVLLKFSDGAPALISVAYGSGNILLFASTVDIEWTNFPLHPVFLPFVLEIAGSITAGNRTYIIEEKTGTQKLKISEGVDRISITDPDGMSEEKRITGVSQDVVFNRAGIWKLEEFPNTQGIQRKYVIPVNPDPAESDISRWEAKELRLLFGKRITFLGDGVLMHGADRFVPLWPLFILLFLISLSLEAVFSGRR